MASEGYEMLFDALGDDETHPEDYVRTFRTCMGSSPQGLALRVDELGVQTISPGRKRFRPLLELEALILDTGEEE